VELAPANFKSPPSTPADDSNTTPNTGPDGQPADTSVVSSILEFSSGVVASAKSLDEQHGISQSISSGLAVVSATVSSWDSQLQISEKARQLTDTVQSTATQYDQQYEISNKASEVGQQVGGFFTVATASAVSGAESAKVAVENFVDTNPQVQLGIETVKAVSSSIGATIGSGFNALFGEGATNK